MKPKTLKIRAGCAGGGKGALIQEDKSATLGCNNDQTLFVPCAYSVENHPADSRVSIRNDGTVQTLTERMGTGGGNVPMVANEVKQEYIVRRLTPTECARLQGFPDWWCADLDTPDPTEDDIAFWSEVFETHRKVVNPDGKPKTRKQIVKWLQHPHTDSAEYKMWGNGVALPNVYYVMCGIASIVNEEV